MGTAIEDVDAVLAVDRDRGDVGQAPPRRQFRPVLHHAVTMFARAENGRHVFSPQMFFVSEELQSAARSARDFIFPSPLVGEGGSIERSEIETGEGYGLSIERDPSSPSMLRISGTFSHKGRREERESARDPRQQPFLH